MKIIKCCLRVVQATGLCVLGLATSHAAGVVELSYDVSQRTDGYVAYDLKARNIGQFDLYDVRIESSNGSIPTLYYNDLAPGITLGQPVAYSWDPAGERPGMVWETSYSDASGNRHVETSEE